MLLISNGHGEDALGVLLARALLRTMPGVRITAFPVVGTGRRYHEAGIEVAGVQREMPTGGFVREGPGAWLRDVRAGLLRLSWEQWRALRRLRRECDWALAVGDAYALWLAGAVLRRPVAFVPTAKSDYIRPHFGIEVRAMRRWCFAVFPRDAVTARGLQARGVPAYAAGNLMMDAVQGPATPLPATSGRTVVGLLPGSRTEAYKNLVFLLQVVERLSPHEYVFPVALAGELEMDRVAAAAAHAGWTWSHEEPLSPAEPSASGGAGGRDEDAAGSPAAVWKGYEGTLRRGDHAVPCFRCRFSDILHASRAVIGMAGTANEQAAGLGIPVLTAPGEGPQFTPKFVATQKRLLGDALWVEPRDPDALAAAVVRLATDEALRARMAQAGKERMGPPGASRAIAECLVELLSRRSAAGRQKDS